MPSQPLVLETKSLTKDFGALKAVDSVNLKLSGGVHSIIGPNGAGKTTLFNLLTGFLKPTAGEIFYLGNKISDLPPYQISQMGMARSFQITSIFPDLSVYENVRIAVQSRLKASYNFLMSFKSLERADQKTEKVLEQVGLLDAADAKAKNLSYGLQRGLDIGISLATDPELILLDEPTSGMDRKDSKQVIQLISDISERVPVLLIEHNIDVVLSISDIVTVMYQGIILAEGTPSEIQQNERVQEAYLGGF
ncbi:MAG: ABC transporter ATP-binding protein [Desulfobacteraceae bacterium]